MLPLFAKELRALRPFLALVVLFVLLDLVFFLFSEVPDQYSLAKLFETSQEGDQQLNFILAFALASGLLVREKDERTLTFLEALPVTRPQIFFAKFLLGFSVITLLPVIESFLQAGVYLLSRTSLDQASLIPRFARDCMLGVLSCFVYFSLGLALSFLRRFSLLVLALLVCTYLLLVELRVPFVTLFNIFALVDPLRPGPAWSLPWLKLCVHLAIGVLCFGLSYVGFLASAESAAAPISKPRRTWVVLGALGSAFGIAVWIGLAAWYGSKAADQDAGEVRYHSWPTVRGSTGRYRFIYPGNQSAIVEQLLPLADRVESKVRQFLQVRPISVIGVDLTRSAPHTAGSAHWKKVNIELLTAGGSLSNLVAVLAHETTHVYLDYATDSRISEPFDATRFFHEGLASFVEYRFFRSSEDLLQLRRVAAVSWHREKARFQELCDNQVLARRRDPQLVYPLGETFVAAVVAKFGDSAPASILRAFSRDGAPKDLAGVALWQDVFQAAGYSLSAAEDAWYRLLEEEVERNRVFIDRLPRLRGSVWMDGEQLRIRASWQGDPPGAVVCRLRASADTPEDHYLYASSASNGEFLAEPAFLPHEAFWYQLGWRTPELSQTAYETWVQVARPR